MGLTAKPLLMRRILAFKPRGDDARAQGLLGGSRRPAAPGRFPPRPPRGRCRGRAAQPATDWLLPPAPTASLQADQPSPLSPFRCKRPPHLQAVTAGCSGVPAPPFPPRSQRGGGGGAALETGYSEPLHRFRRCFTGSVGSGVLLCNLNANDTPYGGSLQSGFSSS